MKSKGLTGPLLDVTAVLSLVLIAAVSSFAQEDVRFWDESFYLFNGINTPIDGPTPWVSNPLFSDIYLLINTITQDPISDYFLGRAVAAAVVVAGVWGAARILTGPVPAFVVGAVAAALPITYVWPGVSGPAAAAVCVGVALVWRYRNLWSLGISVGLFWIAAGMRPEFTWAAIGASVIALVSLVARLMNRSKINESQIHGAFWIIAGAVVLPAVLILIHGSPFAPSDRDFFAFSQHYELRFATPDDDAWQIEADVIGTDFPGATSVFGALLANPPAFLLHVLRNALLLPISLGGHATAMEPGQLLSITLPKIMVGVLLVGLLLSVATDILGTRDWLRRLWRNLLTRNAISPLLMTLLGAGIPLLISVVIYPRPHYLLTLSSLSLVACSLVLARVGNRKVQSWVPVGLMTGLTVLLAMTSLFGLSAQLVNPPINTNSLRQLDQSPEQWRLLSADRPIGEYVDNIEQIDKLNYESPTFADFLDDNSINLVYVAPLLAREDWSALDGFNEFYENPAKFGFEPIVVGSPFVVKVSPTP